MKKMILGEDGERSLKQFLPICSNDNIMQIIYYKIFFK